MHDGPPAKRPPAEASTPAHHGDRFKALLDWYFSPESRSLSIEAAIAEACERFAAAGGTLYRLRLLRLTQRPEVAGLVYEWRAGRPVTCQEMP